MSVRLVFETHSTSTDNEAGVASGWLDPSLSPTGREQAVELGKRNEGVDAVYTSDLRRAVETAEIAFGPGTFTPDERLRESDYGSMSGMSPQVIEGEREHRIEFPFPNGESIRDTVERVGAFLDEIREKHVGERVLVIGHRATRIALDHLLGGVPLERAVNDGAWQPGWEYTA